MASIPTISMTRWLVMTLETEPRLARFRCDQCDHVLSAISTDGMMGAWIAHEHHAHTLKAADLWAAAIASLRQTEQ